MAFDWRDFLLFAHELRNETEESKRRTAIGRAYYIYNATLTEAKKLGYNPNDPTARAGLHKRLWSWCQKHPNTAIVALGDAGSTLHARRLGADYQAAKRVSSMDVQKQLDEAREFEVLLAQIGKTPAPPALP